VDQDVLYALTQGSLNSGIEQLEYSAVQLYMALLSGRDNGPFVDLDVRFLLIPTRRYGRDD